ncbi:MULTISPECIES: thiamine pyrophosphate-binding protein [unclassified Leucobacter]|uniref:thiamine pyrophosphate-binding protein n=1 Tax=unclassified Leucobacter TaxID=2621730 RepID=UPI00165E313F|nr:MULTISPECIES: thiamine pyrophosphate-binding protein [unclassified Leucobacter]MBC9937534.1 thiamine pyrophosphate-binding protein [Leucobacter sp. cx-87]
MIAVTEAATERELAAQAGVAIDNAGLAVLTTIRNYGVDTVFGIPGTHNLEFYRHLAPLGIHPVTTRHEQGAGYGADGWAQQTGLPGVVITTSGPGLLNALSAAGTAYCESRPLIILSPGVPEGEEFADIGSLHETKDPTGAAGAIVEWSRRVGSATEAVACVHEAFALFRTGRPRPVHIEIPLNVLEGQSDCPPELLAAIPAPAPTAGTAAEVDAVARILSEAKRPLIIAGGGAARVGLPLTELAERLGAPVVTTLNGKAAVSEHHPLSIGSELRLTGAHALINRADALLVLGSKLGEAELWGGVIAPEGPVLRVDVLGSQLQKNVAVAAGVVGHCEAVVPQLTAALAGQDRPAWVDLDAVRAALAEESAGFSPVLNGVAARIASVLPVDTIVGGDSSQITYFGMASRAVQERSHSFLYTPAYATLGYGLPASIGARVASPDRPVVCVLGDGALMFAIQEFATAIEQRLDLTVVCVDNGGYAEIKQNERDRGIAPVGVDLAQPDWAALADAFGGHGHRVVDQGDLERVIATAIAEPGLSLVHVPLELFPDAAAPAGDPA